MDRNCAVAAAATGWVRLSVTSIQRFGRNVLVCRLWSSFASNADKEAHAQRWQKHGDDS